MNTFEFTLRLLTAFALGASIGFERQWRKKNAGLRTNTLVCIGSAAFVLIAIRIGGDAAGVVVHVGGDDARSEQGEKEHEILAGKFLEKRHNKPSITNGRRTACG